VLHHSVIGGRRHAITTSTQREVTIAGKEEKRKPNEIESAKSMTDIKTKDVPNNTNIELHIQPMTLPPDGREVTTQHIVSRETTNISLEVQNEVAETNEHGEKRRSNFRLTMIMLALFLSLFIAALDATIVSTAVPTITADLDSPSGYSWIGGAYLIANAAGAP
jgi:hypothetical protein